jgi:hypothetical protein
MRPMARRLPISPNTVAGAVATAAQDSAARSPPEENPRRAILPRFGSLDLPARGRA